MDASSNKTFTLYCANCTGMESNCNYPNPVEITDVDALHCAASRDYVVAQFKHNYRNTANFVSANCLCKAHILHIRHGGLDGFLRKLIAVLDQL